LVGENVVVLDEVRLDHRQRRQAGERRRRRFEEVQVQGE
jgi:hypothetical protein